MGMAVGGQGGVKSDINMTPMIDVLLVLIIIFMVITPLTPKGLEALVPQPTPEYCLPTFLPADFKVDDMVSVGMLVLAQIEQREQIAREIQHQPAAGFVDG